MPPTECLLRWAEMGLLLSLQVSGALPVPEIFLEAHSGPRCGPAQGYFWQTQAFEKPTVFVPQRQQQAARGERVQPQGDVA